MIEKLIDKYNNDNYSVAFEIFNIIRDEKLNNIDELKEYEESIYSSIFGRNLSKQEKVEYCIHKIFNGLFTTEGLEFYEVQEVMRLKEDLRNSGDLDDCIELIVKIYSYMKRELMFPYEAYNLILNDIY